MAITTNDALIMDLLRPRVTLSRPHSFSSSTLQVPEFLRFAETLEKTIRRSFDDLPEAALAQEARVKLINLRTPSKHGEFRFFEYSINAVFYYDSGLKLSDCVAIMDSCHDTELGCLKDIIP